MCLPLCAVGGDHIGRERSLFARAVVIIIINIGVNRAKGSASTHICGRNRVVGHGGGGVHGLVSLGDVVAVSVNRLGPGQHGGGSSGGHDGSDSAGDGSTSSGSGEKAGDTGPGGLLLVLIGVEESFTGTGKDTGDPAVLVGNTPDGNSNTALDVKTGADDVDVLVALLLQLSGRGWDG